MCGSQEYAPLEAVAVQNFSSVVRSATENKQYNMYR